MAEVKAIDLFAGAGGWDVGARWLGIDPLGIELDEAACKTREAAGLPTLKADVAALDPLDFAPCDLLIASPPCQAWSMAGKRHGEQDIGRVYDLTTRIVVGLPGFDATWADPRSKLVTEPLRWALALEPDLIAWEQVPPVLDYWKHCAAILRERGYGTWVGVLSSERFGVPQTRKRAILMAAKGRPVHPPQPTHQAYVPGELAQHQHTLEGELLPWVSMAEALGWNAEIPAPTVTAGGGDNGGPEPFGRGGASAHPLSYRRMRGEGMNERHGDRPDTPTDAPAPTLTGKARSDEWVYDRRQQTGGVPVRLIPMDEPAPAIAAQGLAKGRDVIRRTYVNGTMENAARRDQDEPAPTVLFGHNMNRVEWQTWGEKGDPSERPATTVAGDPRIPPPGHHGHGEQGGPDAIRVSEQEAAILQSFPPDFPFQGSRTARFTQIGNAVPPLLARAILSALTENPVRW